MKRGVAINARKAFGIHRIDNPSNRTYAWVVRIQRRNQIYTKYFSDQMYGGRSVAYKAARAYHEELRRTLRPLTRVEFAQIKRRTNRTGYVGVVKYTTKGASIRRYWIATWPTKDGRRKQRKFSIRKYGERQAFLLARRARRLGLAPLEDDVRV
jgi:hypothetical protein